MHECVQPPPAPSSDGEAAVVFNPLPAYLTPPIQHITRNNTALLPSGFNVYAEYTPDFRTLQSDIQTSDPGTLPANLEVDAEHVYSVAGNGLLVHNEGCVPHGYGIIRSSDGEVMKFGVSRAKDGIQKSGLSNRAQSQLSEIADKFGGSRDDYQSVLLRQFDNTRDMFKWEKETVGIWRAMKHDLPGNLRPKGFNPFFPNNP